MFDLRVFPPVLRPNTLSNAPKPPRRPRRRWARISAGLVLLTALAAQAALATTMTITPYPNPGVAGEELTYHVQVTQGTGQPCSNVTIRLNLPSGVTFRSSRPGGSHNGGQVTWTRSRLHNETVSYWAVVDVDPGLANGTPLNASGSVSGSNCGTQTSVTSPVIPGGAPNLTLSKSASRSHIDAGGQFTYTLTYANTGNADATGVVLTDPLPANTTFQTATGGGSHAGGTVTWNLGQVSAGDSGSVTVSVDVASPLANGTILSNTGTLDSNELPQVVSNTVDVTVDSAPVLRVSKSTPSPFAKPGSTVSYTVHYDNVGSDRATGIVVRDTLPQDVSYVSASPSGTESNGVVTLNLGDLDAGASGQALVTVRVDSPLANGTVLENRIAIESNETAAVDGPQTDVTVVSAPSLTLAKSASRTTAPAGEQIVYTLAYANVGDDQATSVVLEDVLPVDTTFVSATGGGSATGNTVTWNLGTLAAGTSGSVTVTARVADPIANGEILHNTASLDASEIASPVTAFANVTATSAPVLIIVKRASTKTASPNDEITYTISYANSGSDTATGVTLEDHLPPDVTFLSAGGGGVEAGGIVNWALPDLAAGAGGSVSVKVRVNSPLADGLVLHNRATIDSNETVPVSADVSRADVTISSAPAWQFFKASTATNVRPGDTVSYFIQAENTGTTDATGVVIDDTLPTGLTLVSTQPAAAVSGQTLQWSFPSWSPGTRKTFLVTATVDSPQANGTRLENVASIDSNETASTTSRAAVTVTSAPVLEVEKTVSRTLASPGESLVYTLTYRNTGTDQATDVLLEDHLPADTTFVSASGGGVENNGIVDWNLGTVAAGATGSVTVTVTVNSPLANGTILHNAATIESNETAPVSANTQTSDVTISSLPALGAVKTVSARQIRPGDTLVYTISYDNKGTDTATGVTLTDLLPGDVTFVSASGGGSESGGIVTWNLPDLPAGARNAVTLTVSVNSPLADGTRLINSATIDSNETGPSLAITAASSVTVISEPSYLVSKSVSKTTAGPGDTLVYTIDYRNTGTDSGSGLVLTDTLPAGVTFVSASGGGTESGGVVTWNIGTLAAGASGSVSLTVTVDSPLANGTRLSNSANLTDGTRGAIGLVETTVSSAPVLSIAKRASATRVKPGEQLTYFIDIANTGTDQATSVVIQDALPPEVTFVSASAGGTHANGVVTWSASAFPAGVQGQLTVVVTVNSPLANGTVLHNSATIDSDQTAPLSSGVLDVIVDSAPSYILGKSASKKTASPGDTIVYTLDYGNTGTDTGLGVTLTDTLPPGVTFLSASGGGTASNGIVTWPAVDLAAGATGSVTLTVQVDNPLPNGTRLTNSAQLTDGTRGAVSITDTLVDSAPVLTIDKTASRGTASPGDQVVYALTLANTGTDQATGVVVEDHLPTDVTFVSASAGGVHANGIVTWNLGDKPAASTTGLTVTVQVNSPLANGTVLHNTASVTSNETATVSTPVVDVTVNSAPAYQLLKSASRSVVSPGDQLVYTLEYRNTGTDTGRNIVLSDTLPPDVSFVSASGGGTHANGIVSWPAFDLPAAASGSVSVTVTVNSPLANGTRLKNTGNLSDGLNGAASLVETRVDSAPQLGIVKSASKATVNAGDTLVYTLDFANTGTDQATGVVVTDHLPPEVTFVAASGGGTHANGVVTWNLGTKPAGTTGSVSVTVRVNAPLANGTVLHNTATIASNETAPASSGLVDVIVSSAPVLDISKSASRSTVNAGGQLVYTIDVVNNGTDAATAVVVEDHLPTDASFVSASAGGTEAGGVVTWNLGDIPAGSGASVTVTVQAAAPIANGTVLHNTASVTSNETQPANSNGVDVVISSAPVLVLGKTASQSVVNAGGTIAYTITLENQGTDAAANVTIEDHLPTNTSFVSATSGGTHNAGIVTWNIASVAAGARTSVSVTVAVATPLPNGTVLHNQVTAASSQTGTTTAPTIDVRVTSAPQLILDKTPSSAVVNAGGQLTYSLDISNTGTDSATSVVLTDTVPPDTTFVSAGAGGVYDAVSGTVTWDLGTVVANAAGSVSLTLAVNTPLANGTVISNKASLTSAELPPVGANAAVTVSSAPRLVLDKTANPSPNVSSGAQVQYRLTLRNTGTDQATGVTLTDQLPTGATPTAISGGGSFDAGTQTLSWGLGDLQAGQLLTVDYTVTVPLDLPNGSTFINSASARAGNAPAASAATTLTVDSQAQLQLVKTGSNSVEAGQNLTYQLSVTNTGNLTASGVVLTDTLPAGTSFVSATNGGTQGGGAVTWNLGDLAPLTSTSVELVLQADLGLLDGTVLVNSAAAAAANTGSVAATASTVVRSHVELTQTMTGTPDPVAAGADVTFTVITENIGNEDATGVEVRATLPPNTQFVSATGGGTYDAVSNEVVWTLGALAAQAVSTVEFLATVDDPLLNGTLLTSSASGTSNESLPVSSQATVTVTSAPLLLFGKQAPTTPAREGDTVTFTLSLENVGNENATGVVVTDTLPNGLVAVAASAGGIISADRRQVTWNLGTVAAGGAPVTFTVNARVQSNQTGQLVNTAVAASNESTDIVASAALPTVVALVQPVPGGHPLANGLLIVLLLLIALAALRPGRAGGF